MNLHFPESKRRNDMRNRLLAVVLAVATIGATSCGGGSSNEQTGGTSDCPVDLVDKAEKPIEITAWHIVNGLQLRTLEKIVKDYEASQPNVRVKLESQGSAVTELHSKMDQALPDRSLPALVMPDDTKLRYIADSGQFLPAQACYDADPESKKIFDDILPILKTSYSIDDQLWPVGFTSGTGLVYYNRSHFEAAGLDPDSPPKTIDEMIEMGRKIKAAGVNDAPVVLKAQPWVFEWWLSGAQVPLVNNNNGRGEGLPTESEFGNPTTKTILNKLRDAEKEGILKVTPSAPTNSDHILAMATQSSSMVIESSSGTTTIAGIIDGTIKAADAKAQFGVDIPDGMKLDLDLGVGPLPGLEEAGLGQVGGMIWYISNTVPAEQQSAAWDFMKYLNSPKAQMMMSTDGGAVPNLVSVAESPELAETWSKSLGGRWQKVATDVMSGVDSDFPGPVIGPYDEVRSAIGKAMDTVLLDGKAVDPAVAGADRTITKALESYAADVGG